MKKKNILSLSLCLIFSSSLLSHSLLAENEAQLKIRLMSSALKAYHSNDYESAKRDLEELIKMAPKDRKVENLLDTVNEALRTQQAEEQSHDTDVSTAPSARSKKPPPSASPSASSPTSPNPSPSDTSVHLESLKQRQAIEDAQLALSSAKNLAAAGFYWEAIRVIDNALGKLPPTTATQDVTLALQSLRKSIVTQRRSPSSPVTMQSPSSAPTIPEEPYAIVPDEEPLSTITTEGATEATSLPESAALEVISPGVEEEQSEVEALLNRGKAQFIAGDYDGAQETFGRIEARDPDNTEAKYFQTEIAEIQRERGPIDRKKTKEQMLTEVSQAWQRPQIFNREVRPGGPVLDRGLREKLQQIIIPTVNFSGVNLSRVIETLSALSLDYDLAAEGINMVLIDPTRADPAVNLTLRNLPLSRILDFVVESVGYEYDVQPDAVVVRQGVSGPGTRLETEFFPITRSTIIRLTGIGAGRAPVEATYNPFDPNPPVLEAEGKISEEEEALKSFLQRAGVPFDPIPNATLALADGQLIVTNTPRNIEKVLNLLRRYSEVKQVEIESKFLDVQEGDLEELGFDWLIEGGDYTFRTNNRSLNDAFSISGEQSAITITGQPDFPLLPPATPRGIDLAEDITEPFADISAVDVLGNFNIDFAVRALSRKEGNDLMSAPKVTVLSGKTAEIVVAQELRYPESYGDIESDVGSGSSNSDVGTAGVTITAGTPQDFTVRNVGVEMEVTPTVEDDDSISLLLEPKVTEFEGFVEYGGPSIAIASDTTVTVPAGFFQPIFSVREVRTEVTIWDGATVVMGGLTREEVRSVNDKVPVLGDIPLFGRLFKSEGETAQKRNLLIFVTANLISPGGSPSQQQFRTVASGSLFQNPTIVTPGGGVSRGPSDKP